jgi:ribosomal protein S15P/S13E
MPSEAETTHLVKLYETALAAFKSEPEQAAALITPPETLNEHSNAKPADVPELAAWTAVANVLLNLDEVLMRR